jgi:hypothetical protein
MRQSACLPPDDHRDVPPDAGPPHVTGGRVAGVVGLAAVLALAAIGCPPPEADDRPDRPGISDSGGQRPITIGGGSGGSAGAGGVATGGSLSEWSTTTLAAEVHEINAFNTRPAYPTDPIVNSGPHPGQVSVVAEGRDEETFVKVEAEAEFEIDGVRESDGTWVRVISDDFDVMDMLHQVDTADQERDTVFVIQVLLMEQILAQVNTGLGYDANRAQIVVRIIDENRDGVAGVTVAHDGAEDVLFQDLNVWTAAADATDSSGLALLVNVPAEDADGASETIIVGARAVSVPVYPDTVTLVEIPAP